VVIFPRVFHIYATWKQRSVLAEVGLSYNYSPKTGNFVMRCCGYSYEAFSSLKAAVIKEGACRLDIDAFVTWSDKSHKMTVR